MALVDLTGVEFTLFAPDDIRKLSVMEVKTSVGLNPFGHPLREGLYDLRMGPSTQSSDPCDTCHQLAKHCPGHFGHIDLPLPVVNPLFHKGLLTLMRLSCRACKRILLPGKTKSLLINQLRLLDEGLVSEALGVQEVVQGVVSDDTPENVAEVLVKDALESYMSKYKGTASTSVDTTLLEALRAQFLGAALKLLMKGKTCPYCKAPLKPVTSFQNRIMTSAKVEIAGKFKDGESSSSAMPRRSATLLPTESKEILRSIWMQDQDFVAALHPVLRKTHVKYPTDLFFMDVILLPPPKTRPLTFSDGMLLESRQVQLYKLIINDCVVLRNIKRVLENDSTVTEDVRSFIKSVKGETPLEKLSQCWYDLQCHVDHLLDTEMSNQTRVDPKRMLQGLKQALESKEGIIRMNMMGKRVNYAARSVITPDPNVNIEEIGIPVDFAKRLTYPVPVNLLNVEYLRQLVINGPDVYPGATHVEKENGHVTRLLGGDKAKMKRIGCAKMLLNSGVGGKTVHRHLLNGDMLLLNRQPTLHRPSIMAHKARILPSAKTFRMHYSNCKSYNADFDGDEMNAHCPQSEAARSEAMTFVNVSNQYLVPKDGTPLGGLIQDHVISGVHLTARGQMFNRHDYRQLVYQALSDRQGVIKLLPPCIIKPKALWSGKQVISTVLQNIIPSGKDPITLTSSAKTSLKSWERYPPRPWRCGTQFADPKTMSEAEVIVLRGHLLCGVLDKQHFGATQYSLTHCLYELYGGQASTNFLTSLGKLFTFYLQWIGFTIGVEDIIVRRKPDRKRREIILEARKIGDKAATKALHLDETPEDLSTRLEEAYFKDRVKFRAELDNEYKKALDEYTNRINKVCLPAGLHLQFPRNNLQLMVVSGAKGSTVNTMQISCLLGQIELEGKRPPLMISGRSLPSFKPFETSPRAGGYVDGRFMTGITPQDFFFHCMAGREGLIDTAVKTSRSGYLQRCLIKHLEGVVVAYDHTVRNHDSSVIQFAYGEDGMEVGKATFFKAKQMEFLYRNRNSILDRAIVKDLQDKDTDSQIAEQFKEIRSWRAVVGDAKMRKGFTRFSADLREKLPEKYFHPHTFKRTRLKAYHKTLKKWRKLDDDARDDYKDKYCPDPVTSSYRPYRDFGAICETLDKLILDYIQSKPLLSPKSAKSLEKTMRNLISLKSMSSLAAPGEPVGLLAAQSIGEPSTQMTLNTFHFAGRGEMNVTLGIPRLREILMTASKSIKTPSMDIPLLPSRKAEKRAAGVCRKLRQVTVADVLEKITVRERLEIMPSRIFTYTVRFHFLPHRAYRKEFVVTPASVLKHMELKFLVALSKTVRALGKKFGDLIHVSDKEVTLQEADEEENADDVDASGKALEGRGIGEAHESSDEDEAMDDEDATGARLRARHQEDQDYEEPDESDVEFISDEEEMAAADENEEGESGVGGDENEQDIPDEVRKVAELRIAEVLRTFTIVRKYSFDMEKEEWCEIVIGIPLTLSKIDCSTTLRGICESSVIFQVPDIKRAIVGKANNGEVFIKTDGINMTSMVKFEKVLDLRRIYCNDVHQMAATYGIEAGVRVIVRELKRVFEVYGITVDSRHLSLIADYMTVQGTFLPLSRTGMACSPSPLQQMSFESSVQFLRTAISRGKLDSLTSPSARIMVGRACSSGTGAFDTFPA